MYRQRQGNVALSPARADIALAPFDTASAVLELACRVIDPILSQGHLPD
jgi:hypothetical protein